MLPASRHVGISGSKILKNLDIFLDKTYNKNKLHNLDIVQNEKGGCD